MNELDDVRSSLMQKVPPSVPMYLGILDCFSDCSTVLKRSVTSTALTL